MFGWRGFLLIFGIGLAAISVLLFLDTGVEGLAERLRGLGPVLAIAYVLLFAVSTMLLVPSSLMSLLGGLLFGPWWGSLWILLGALSGATGSFLVGRHLLGERVRQRFAEKAPLVFEEVEAEGWRVVALLRVTPVIPFVMANYLLSITDLRLRTYVWSTLLFMAPSMLAMGYLGHAGRGLLDASDSGFGWLLWGSALAVFVLLLPGMVTRWRQRHARLD